MTQDSSLAAAGIRSGDTYLGIEFGSTRIKSVLIDSAHTVLASGSYNWENCLENGFWTYSLDEIVTGMQSAYAKLAAQVMERYGEPLGQVGAIGVSAMMHGYMAFDASGALLTPFRTWRNTTTDEAAGKLSTLFQFNIPQRWSVAHLYQAILNNEPHVSSIAFLTTLAGYLHWRLTGERVIGVGDGSGMFPVDDAELRYQPRMAHLFNGLLVERNLPYRLEDILPRLLPAGASAGALTPEGAALLDPTGTLRPGIPFCPPEGDAGTGMVATNSISPRTGNVSAGTSVFAMLVLEHPLSRYYPEVDMVTTPAGDPVAMVHCNNCTSDIDAWIRLFGEAAHALGAQYDERTLYQTLYRAALEGTPDCGGLMAFNYLSGEPVTGLEEGRPLLMRKPDAAFTLANVMRAHLTSACASLRIGMEILQAEQAKMDVMTGHGGFFQAGEIGQKILSAALNTPISVMETAGAGGPWGMAILAAYMKNKAQKESLADYLAKQVFLSVKSTTVSASDEDAAGFASFLKDYRRCLAVEHAAVQSF